jgi:hypothetical protein
LPRARFTDQPDEWPVTDTFSLLCAICALSNVAVGLSDCIISLATQSAQESQELAFCRARKRA